VSKKPKKTAKQKNTGRNGTDSTEPVAERVFEPALCIVGETRFDVFGLSTPDRLMRQFQREGLTTVLSVDDARHRNGPVIFIRGDAVIDQPLIPVLLKRPNLLLLSSADQATPVAVTLSGIETGNAVALLSGEGPPSDHLKLLVRTPEGLDVEFWKGLRKRETPYAQTISAQTLKSVEWRMFMGTYKGATDFVTKHVWPRPAFHVTRMLAPTGITPNMVTTVSAIAMILAFWLFLEGHFAAGLIAAWFMTFLDTVDGKLARTTLTSSKWGDIFDHGIDLVHPPFWYAAWAYGLMLGASTWSSGTLRWLTAVIFAGYIVQRLMEGIAIKWLGLEIHIWRPIDTFFRQITARRNPNLALLSLFTLIGKPDWGFLAVAVWTVVCLLLHGVQLMLAFNAKKASGPLQSWMSAPAKAK
jgi:phosphatidylglycerophosphate synthase